MRHARIIAPPQRLAVRRVDAQDIARRRLRIGAQDEELLAPEHRRAMSDSRQLDPPVQIFVGPTCGNRRRLALARAIGPAKASPLLGMDGFGQNCNSRSQQQRKIASLRMGGTSKPGGKKRGADILSAKTWGADIRVCQWRENVTAVLMLPERHATSNNYDNQDTDQWFASCLANSFFFHFHFPPPRAGDNAEATPRSSGGQPSGRFS